MVLTASDWNYEDRASETDEQFTPGHPAFVTPGSQATRLSGLELMSLG